MKKVLITGANSYIGTSFQNYIEKHYPDEYQIDTVDMIDGSWREKDFSSYDVVYHVAGIAHADTSKVSEEEQKKYYAINTDLTIETAKKAKSEGVRQFIFMSSIIVYGASGKYGETKVITRNTVPHPANFYGDSKLKAEEGIMPLSDEAFKVAILRPPMIYGPGSKGNYPKLSKIVQKLPAFPYVKNERSMLYIENLCEFIHLIMEDRQAGTFFPQNEKYVNTSNLVKLIAAAHGKNIKIIPGFSPSIKLAGEVTELVNKAFGSLVYDREISGDIQRYSKVSLGRSIARTEFHAIENNNKTTKSSKKHILVVSQYFYPEPFRINDICKEWIKKGYRVTVLTGIPNYPQGKFYDGYGLGKKRQEIWNEIEIIRIPIIPRGNKAFILVANYFSFVVSGFVWTIRDRVNADVVFIFEVSPMTQALVGVWTAKKEKIPCLLYVQDLWPENIESIAGITNRMVIAAIDKMVEYIYSQCTLVLTTSKSFVTAVAKHGISTDKIEYWPQYAESFYKPIDSIEGNRPFTIMFTGNIGEGQGLDVLVKAIRLLKSDGLTPEDVSIVLVGDGRFKNTLIQNVKENDLNDFFVFESRKQPEEISGILSKCDVAFLGLAENPVFNMTIPAKLQSYIACGKPILACADGETKKIIEEAKCGFCIKPGQSDLLAEYIIKFKDTNRQTLKNMGENAQAYSDKYFNKQILMNQMDSYLGEANERINF